MAAPSGNTCGLMERSIRERVPPLLTDLYQFTMAYAYWRTGRHQEPAVFELFFRDNPFGGGFSLFTGLHDCLLFLRSFHFTDEGEEVNTDYTVFYYYLNNSKFSLVERSVYFCMSLLSSNSFNAYRCGCATLNRATPGRGSMRHGGCRWRISLNFSTQE